MSFDLDWGRLILLASTDAHLWDHASAHEGASEFLFFFLNNILFHRASYRHLLGYRGDKAQLLVNGLQQTLYLSLSSSEKANMLKALLRLSKASNLLPSSFYLNNVRHVQRIGKFATPSTDVYRGTSGGQSVFLKRYRLFSGSWTQDERAELLNREAIIWANHQHPGVLPFLGVFQRDDAYDAGLYLVSPFLEHGTIVDYLVSYSNADRRLLMRDVFNAMSYLHGNDIVHGDLKGANILINASGRACLADLGLSRLTAAGVLTWTTVQSSPSLGTVPWQAPELLRDYSLLRLLVPTAASDVYSLGCLAYEVFTNRAPFWDVEPHSPVRSLKILKEVTKKGRRPTKPEVHSEAYSLCGLTEGIWDTMGLCWHRDPSLRPSASDLSMLPSFVDVADNRTP